MNVDDPLEGFVLAVSFADSGPVVAVQGEIDVLSAPELRAVLGGLIDAGHTAVVLDLAGCTFLDAAGLGVISDGIGRLHPSAGTLTLRSPSSMVRRLLRITGMVESVVITEPELRAQRLGPEQAVHSPPEPARSGRSVLYPTLRKVSAIPADDDVVDGALRLVVALARATVSGAGGVSVSLLRHGRLSTVAATDQTIADMDADQYATGEGPCLDASVQGRWFHVESLATETRWPAFTAKAQLLGIRAILSSPLTARDLPVGALNIYSRTEAAFATKDQQLAAVFATEASAILSAASVEVTDEAMSRRFQEALSTRQIIAQAQGVVMAREGVSADAAYSLLRSYSQASGQPLRERAETVVESTRRDRINFGAGPVGVQHG